MVVEPAVPGSTGGRMIGMRVGGVWLCVWTIICAAYVVPCTGITARSLEVSHGPHVRGSRMAFQTGFMGALYAQRQSLGNRAQSQSSTIFVAGSKARASSSLQSGMKWLKRPISWLQGGGRRKGLLKGAAGARAMFTGIVEEIGTVEELFMDIKVPGVTLTVKGDVVMDGCYEGCSIAINGVCLTVTKFSNSKKQFTVGVSPETLRLTNLGDLAPLSKVNLERAAPMDGRNSGHMVQGHVDDVGEIVETWPDQDSLFIKVKAPPRLMAYIVPKGFIAIDGTSLTVCDTNIQENTFTFMLIEYTQKHVIIPSKPIGGKVNLEVDVMGKYVERAMAGVNYRLDRIEATLGAIPPPDEGGRTVTERLQELETAVENKIKLMQLEGKL